MIRYEDTAKVTCVDNGETVMAEILEFKPEVLLSISLERKIKLVLKYNVKSDEYQAELYGRTFISKGPKGTHYTTTKR
jgi:hypothetical protein